MESRLSMTRKVGLYTIYAMARKGTAAYYNATIWASLPSFEHEFLHAGASS